MSTTSETQHRTAQNVIGNLTSHKGPGAFANERVECEVAYENNLAHHTAITIVERNGLPMTLPASGDRSDTFVVIKKYTVGRDVELDLYNTVLSPVITIDGKPEAESLAMQNVMKEVRVVEDMYPRMHPDRHNAKVITMTYSYTRQDLESSIDTGVYLSNVDLVVSLYTDVKTLLHPYRAEVQVMDTQERMAINDPDITTVSIYLIDSRAEALAVRKYVNYAGIVMPVMVSSHQSKQDGLYICWYNPVTKRKSTRHLPIDDVKTGIYLHDTSELARTHGDPKSEHKALMDAEITRLKRENDELEIKRKDELAALEITRKQELSDIDRLITEDKRKHTEEMLKMKASYTEREYARKDSSETLKFIPILIAAIAAITAGYMKLSNNKD